MNLSIIIPCYNEEKSIAKVIDSIPKAIKETSEIIVVDNNSIDRTAEIAKKFEARVIIEKKQGYGAALKTGFRNANGDIIVTLDGDGQHPAEMIPEMVKYLKKNNIDFLSASRFPLKDKKVMSLIRRFGNYFLTKAANLIFNLNLIDSQSGMWIFKKSFLKNLNLESDGMSLSEEIKIKAVFDQKIKFCEYYIEYKKRDGKSKLLSIKDGFKNLIFLLKIRFKMLTKNIKIT